MDWKLFAAVFTSVFVAELGDKTQLATMMFASRSQGDRWTVFASAALALVATTALGVLAGQLIGSMVSERVLKWTAGVMFVAIGAWTIWKA